jgi:exodeoxyribonuclease VIII
MKPGIYAGLSFEEYLEIDAVSRSRLALIKHSLSCYKEQPKYESSPSFKMGSMCHCGKLEAEQFASRYVVLPDFHLSPDNKTKKGEQTDSKATTFYKTKVEEFLMQHPGKQEVSSEWLEKMLLMLRSLEAHERSSKFFASGMPEVTIVWVDPKTKIKCKSRLDWVPGVDNKKPDYTKVTEIVDLKTLEDCTKFDLDEYDYHLQAAMYLEGWKVLTKKKINFEFCVVEKGAPYSVRCAPASAEALGHGKQEYDWLLARLRKALDEDKWPGPKDPQHWNVSPWYKPLKFASHIG